MTQPDKQVKTTNEKPTSQCRRPITQQQQQQQQQE